MIFQVKPSVENLLVLGAGASKDYNLPVWSELESLIRARLNSDTAGIYQFKNEIRDWLDSVGSDKEYKTIDECIKHSSVLPKHQSDGELIEDQIFHILQDIFDEAYKDNEQGWIRILNNKMLESGKALEQEITFINYNYDDVLERNLLQYGYLPSKARRLIHRNRLARLSQVSFDVLYPHGNVFPVIKNKDSHVNRHSQTMKSIDKALIDAVSCYESYGHQVIKHGFPSGMKLYLLGLGGGMQVNLNNIDFSNNISEIHTTVFDERLKDPTVSFLSQKYTIPQEEINVYRTCDELVEKCF